MSNKTGPKPRPVSERLWEKIDKKGEDECWPWLGANGNGTRAATMYVFGKNISAYRVVFEDQYPEYDLKSDDWIMHTCNDHNCMNPKHLYIGNRVEWAKKWHGADYDTPEEEKKQRKRDKVRARYQNDKNIRDKRKTYVAEYQIVRKIKAANYLGGSCKKCGESHPSALQFHHRDPSTKLFMISTKELGSPKKYPWDTVIIPELDKCDLLCANCHFKHHAKLSDERIEELKIEVANEN